MSNISNQTITRKPTKTGYYVTLQRPTLRSDQQLSSGDKKSMTNILTAIEQSKHNNSVIEKPMPNTDLHYKSTNTTDEHSNNLLSGVLIGSVGVMAYNKLRPILAKFLAPSPPPVPPKPPFDYEGMTQVITASSTALIACSAVLAFMNYMTKETPDSLKRRLDALDKYSDI